MFSLSVHIIFQARAFQFNIFLSWAPPNLSDFDVLEIPHFWKSRNFSACFFRDFSAGNSEIDLIKLGFDYKG